MIRARSDNCKNKAWCWSSYECQGKPFQCFVCNKTLSYRDRHNHFNNPNQYLVCRMCNVNKHITQYRFKHFYCRLCIYLHRSRFHHTKETFLEHAQKYNIRKAGSKIEV